MIRFAKATIDLWERQGDRTILEHLRQAETSSGEWNPDLHPEPPPETLEYLWHWFIELHLARGGDGPLDFVQIGEWSRLMGNDVMPQEVQMIRRIDGLYQSMRMRESRNGSR